MRSAPFLALLVLLILPACGYHTPGEGDAWIGGEARTLYVELFANRTREPFLENYLTDQIIYQLARSRMVELTERRDSADLVLQGTIESFTNNALAYDRLDRITEYRGTINVVAQLVRRADGQVLWRERLARSEEFPAAVDKNLQLESQDLAARETAKRLAELLYSRMFNAF